MQAGLPKAFWGDCAHIINRLPTPTLQNKTPFEALHHKKPSFSNMKPLGCLALAYNPNQNQDKLNPRGVPCVFLGYPASQKGYKFLNLLTKHTFVSRDVKWYENIFPYTLSPKHLTQIIPSSHEHIIHPPPLWEDSSDDEPTDPDPLRTEPTSDPATSQPAPLPPDPPLLRRSDRIKQPPGWLADYKSPIANHTTATLNPQFHCFMANLHQTSDPLTFSEASMHPHWVKAMNEELAALEENHTWVITDLPLGKKTIGCKWIFKTKYLPDGNVERYKARLVIMGNRQQYGIDYLETFCTSCQAHNSQGSSCYSLY